MRLVQRLQVRKGRGRLVSGLEHVVHFWVMESIVWARAGWLHLVVLVVGG